MINRQSFEQVSIFYDYYVFFSKAVWSRVKSQCLDNVDVKIFAACSEFRRRFDKKAKAINHIIQNSIEILTSTITCRMAINNSVKEYDWTNTVFFTTLTTDKNAISIEQVICVTRRLLKELASPNISGVII